VEDEFYKPADRFGRSIFMMKQRPIPALNPPPNLIKSCKDGSLPPICFHLDAREK
jgi:hypothetical protein